MRTSSDAVLSLQRYFAIAMGAEWDVRLWSDEGSFSPPVARIAEAGPLLSARHGRGSVDCTLPLQVHCYSAPAQTPSLSLARAREVEELLTTIIETGIAGGWPRRIPLYDFPGETRNAYDYLRVSDFSLARVQDSTDPTLVVVVADLRVAWSRPTLIDPAQVLAAELRLSEDPA